MITYLLSLIKQSFTGNLDSVKVLVHTPPFKPPVSVISATPYKSAL
jgi:hypothetical protein